MPRLTMPRLTMRYFACRYLACATYCAAPSPAQVLKSGGNVLLLDEPTNDLDVNTMRSLEEARCSTATQSTPSPIPHR